MSGLFVNCKQAVTNITVVFSVEVKGISGYKVFRKVTLTGAIKACRDGVQKGVLWGQEALHHRHFYPDVG